MSRALSTKSGYRLSEKIVLVNSAGSNAVARALRLAVQDIALSRRKHGFDSRRARHLPSGAVCHPANDLRLYDLEGRVRKPRYYSNVSAKKGSGPISIIEY